MRRADGGSQALDALVRGEGAGPRRSPEPESGHPRVRRLVPTTENLASVASAALGVELEELLAGAVLDEIRIRRNGAQHL